MPKRHLSLDGTTLEGGGQLVRVALALAALTHTPLSITSIRGRRSGNRGKPGGGLKESHLAALNALAGWCGAEVEGGSVGSSEIGFFPGLRKLTGDLGKEIEIRLERPGSVWLIVQAVLPFLLLGGLGRQQVNPDDQKSGGANSPSNCITLTLHGGTNVSNSMSSEYVQLVLLPMLAKIGLPGIEATVLKRGWTGNAPAIGEVKLLVPTAQCAIPLKEFRVDRRGNVERVGITILAGSEELRDRVYAATREKLRAAFPDEEVKIEADILDLSGDSRRLYVLLVASTTSGWRLGRDYLWSGRAIKGAAAAEAMVQEAARLPVMALRREVERGGCVDEYLQDQLVVFQALAAGQSVVDGGRGRAEGTLHTRTVRWVCGEILREKGIAFDETRGCKGVGWGAGASDQEGVDGGLPGLKELTLRESA